MSLDFWRTEEWRMERWSFFFKTFKKRRSAKKTRKEDIFLLTSVIPNENRHIKFSRQKRYFTYGSSWYRDVLVIWTVSLWKLSIYRISRWYIYTCIRREKKWKEEFEKKKHIWNVIERRICTQGDMKSKGKNVEERILCCEPKCTLRNNKGRRKKNAVTLIWYKG